MTQPSNIDQGLNEFDSEAFHARIEKYVKDAEKHLNLPPDAIGNTFMESDFGFVVKMCGVIEPLLKESVRERVRKAIEHPKVAMSGSDALLKAISDLGVDRLRVILFEFGEIDSKSSAFIYALFQIRNRYAHHIGNAHLKVKEICEKISTEPNGDKKLLSKLTGLDRADFSDLVLATVLRSAMFYNVAWFLRDVIKIVNPPPLPTGGLLSQYFDEISHNRSVSVDN